MPCQFGIHPFLDKLRKKWIESIHCIAILYHSIPIPHSLNCNSDAWVEHVKPILEIQTIHIQPSLVGAFNPSKKKKASWDDYSQYMRNKKCSKPHQPVHPCNPLRTPGHRPSIPEASLAIGGRESSPGERHGLKVGPLLNISMEVVANGPMDYEVMTYLIK